jgi:hypothetical protein
MHASVISESRNPDSMRRQPMTVSERAKASQPVPRQPAIDDRELNEAHRAFAPKGDCTWCDRRRGWVEEHRRAKRAVQRKKRSRSGSTAKHPTVRMPFPVQ